MPAARREAHRGGSWGCAGWYEATVRPHMLPTTAEDRSRPRQSVLLVQALGGEPQRQVGQGGAMSAHTSRYRSCCRQKASQAHRGRAAGYAPWSPAAPHTQLRARYQRQRRTARCADGLPTSARQAGYLPTPLPHQEGSWYDAHDDQKRGKGGYAGYCAWYCIACQLLVLRSECPPTTD